MPEKQLQNQSGQSDQGQADNQAPQPDYKAMYEELQKKQIDLNKGIAKYRDEAQRAKEEFEKLKEEFEDLKSKIEFEADGEDVKIHPEDEKKLEVWAQKKGLITRSELEAEKATLQQEQQKTLEAQAVEEFLNKYPQYDTDENWEKIRQLFALYRTPTSLQGYRILLERIHKELSGAKSSEDAYSKAKAELQAKGRLTLGGGSQSSGKETREEQIERLRQRYPNLNRDQIEAQLFELENLYRERQKK